MHFPAVAISLLSSLALTSASAPAPAPAFPHPAITEVLFNVPKTGGDANRDGVRSAAADEFVELINPHDKPITLTGYRIVSRLIWADPQGKRGVRFTFPEFTLAPSEIVVIFNGHDAPPAGEVGTKDTPPAAPNDTFNGAWVFTMDMPSKNRAFSNAGDFVLLLDPNGQPVDGVVWGKPSVTPPGGDFRLSKVEANPKGSVQRTDADSALWPHKAIDRTTCSPGALPAAP